MPQNFKRKKDFLKFCETMEKKPRTEEDEEPIGDPEGHIGDDNPKLEQMDNTKSSQAPANNRPKFINASQEKIYFEYLRFMTQLPVSFPKREDLIQTVEENLNIKAIDVKNLNFRNVHIPDDQPIIEELAAAIGTPLRVMAPPVTNCLYCNKQLRYHHGPSPVIVHTLTGPYLYSKYITRCQQCRVPNENIIYHNDRYGNGKSGWKFYPTELQHYTKASSEVYISSRLIDSYMADLHHGFMSIECKAEAYNEMFRNSYQVKTVKSFLALNPKVGGHFKLKGKLSEGKTSMFALSNRALSTAVYTREVVSECLERKTLHEEIFGPKYDSAFPGGVVQFEDSLESVMNKVDQSRTEELYEHTECPEACKRRGCGKLIVCDGLWKLYYSICMFDVIGITGKVLEKYVPNVCPKKPVFSKAFCSEHCAVVERLGYPSDLREFLISCGTKNNPVDPNKYSKPMKHLVEWTLSRISQRVEPTNETSTDAQGTTYLLRNRNIANEANFTLLGDGEDCNKDTGEIQRLQRFSKGIIMFVTGGGIIRSWAPIYKSESPTQVVLLMIKHLQLSLQNISPENWHKIFLVYDNMCNVDRLRMLRDPLPLEGEFSNIWQKVTKCIDSLHISNHKRPECKVKYAPEKVKNEIPEANLMSCEQTFSWAGRYKKILNSCTKTHFHFLLHRLVKKRNDYTQYCYVNNKKPLLPSLKLESSSKHETPMPQNI